MASTLHTRKDMRLRDYDYSQPGFYFVTVCTFERQELFRPWVGAHLCVRPPLGCGFLFDWMHRIEDKYPGVQVDSSCVMPDHIHMLLNVAGAHAGAPLPEIIKWYKTQTTNEYIRQVRAGLLPPFRNHVWQRGYYDHILRSDDDLLNTRAYIQRNPLKLTDRTEQNG